MSLGSDEIRALFDELPLSSLSRYVSSRYETPRELEGLGTSGS
jgi:hypothetical protein